MSYLPGGGSTGGYRGGGGKGGRLAQPGSTGGGKSGGGKIGKVQRPASTGGSDFGLYGGNPLGGADIDAMNAAGDRAYQDRLKNPEKYRQKSPTGFIAQTGTPAAGTTPAGGTGTTPPAAAPTPSLWDQRAAALADYKNFYTANPGVFGDKAPDWAKMEQSLANARARDEFRTSMEEKYPDLAPKPIDFSDRDKAYEDYGVLGGVGHSITTPFDTSGFQTIDMPGGEMPGVRQTQWGALPDVRRTDYGSMPDVRRTDYGSMPGVRRTDFSGAPNVRYSDFGGMPDVRRTDFGSLPQLQTADFGGLQSVTTGKTPLVRQRGDLAGRLEGMFAGFQGEHADLKNRYRQYERDYALGRPGDFGAERASVERAVYDRAMNLMQPEFDRQEQRIQTDLVNRGLAPTSEAYNDLYGQFADQRQRDITDLSLASVQAGAQEHQRLADLTSRNRGQLFGEAMGLFGAGQQMYGAGEGNVGAIDRLNQAEESERHRQSQRELALRQQQAREQQMGFENSLAARQQMAGEGAQRYGEDMGLRRQLGSEQMRGFDESLAGRQLFGQEGQQRFGQDLAYRGLLGQEGQQRYAQDMGYRGLLNQEGQQRYQQDMGLRGQMFGEDLQRGAQNYAQDMGYRTLLGNEQSRRFGQQAQLRQQQLAEALMKRQLPMQELAMLLSGVAPGGLPGMPQFTQTALQAPDYMGLVGSNYAANQNRRGANKGGMLGAFGSLGGAAINAGIFSDRRLKENIRRIGKAENGLPIYAFNYKGDGRTVLGFMADEVETVHPEAVSEIGGLKVVHYAEAVQPVAEAA